MNGRQLKRVEDLLRRGLDAAAAPGERDTAFTEALRIVADERAKVLAGEWVYCTVMRFRQCGVCGVKIKPAERVLNKKGSDSYVHNKCYEEQA